MSPAYYEGGQFIRCASCGGDPVLAGIGSMVDCQIIRLPHPEPVGDAYKSMEMEIARLKVEANSAELSRKAAAEEAMAEIDLLKRGMETQKVLLDGSYADLARLRSMSMKDPALSIFLDDAPQHYYRHGTRLSLRVDMCPDMFEHSWLVGRRNGDGMVDISYLARMTGKEVGEKVERAMMEWWDKRNGVEKFSTAQG